MVKSCRNKKWHQNKQGWAMALATDELYQLWWDHKDAATYTQPQSVRLQVSDLMAESRADASKPEHLFITFNYTQVCCAACCVLCAVASDNPLWVFRNTCSVPEVCLQVDDVLCM